jgi:DNA-binding MarR family transcriptional regulator
MPLLLLKDLPRYECLLEASREFPDLDPSATEAFLHLLRTGDEAFRVIESNLTKFEISQGRFGVLMALATNCRQPDAAERLAKALETNREHRVGDPCLTPAELAERTAVTRATMTGLIDTLEKDGLVTREPHPQDRRMMSVKLTDRGAQLLSRILPEHFRLMAWLLEPLDETERKTLLALLTKILARAAELPTAPAESLSVPPSANR